MRPKVVESLESLRGDAYIPCDALKKENAVLQLIEDMKKAVFPHTEHEAKELYRICASVGARQESLYMAHYISRRKRWWKKLKVDDEVEVSEPVLTDLLVDNACLSRQGKWMILTAGHENPTYETASEAWMRQHGRIHIREHQTVVEGIIV